MIPDRMRLLSTTRLFAGTSAVYHISYYHAPRAGYQDKVSRSLHDFRDRHEPELSRWIAVARAMVPRVIRPELLLRVLDSDETIASGVSPTDMLCETIAEETGAQFVRERLTKSRPTARLLNIPGRAARLRELADVYHFDAKGLPEKPRVLLVDDIAVTGASLEAAACAIKSALPGAQLTCFVLGRADGTKSNAHLDPLFFTSPAPLEHPYVDAPQSSRGPMTPVRVKVADRPSITPAADRQAPRAGRTGKARKRMMIAGGLVLLVLGIGLVIPLRGPKDAMASEDLVPPPVPVAPPPTEAAFAAPPADQAAPNTKAQELTGPLGVVNVPGVNLRSTSSIEGRLVPKGALRRGELVSVVQHHSPGNGPSWIQVRTRSGRSGWLFASLISERTGKPGR